MTYEERRARVIVYGWSIFILVIFILFLISIAYAGTATVSWDANTEPDLAGYKIYFGLSSGSYGSQIQVGNIINSRMSVRVNGLELGREYFFVVTAIDFSGNESGFSNEVNIILADSTEDPPEDPPVDPPTEGSVSFKAYCFPNPFGNQGATITVIIPNSGNLSIDIYTVTGRFIRNLVKDLSITEGEHHFKWDGKDQYGNSINPGIYLGSVTLGSLTTVIKMAIKP